MYKEFYHIYKKSLDTSTVNYSPLSSAPATIRNVVLGLAPNELNINLNNIDDVRIYFRGIINLKIVFVFVDINDMENSDMNTVTSAVVNNKCYIISYRKFEGCLSQENLIRCLYRDLYYINLHMNCYLNNNGCIEFSDIVNEEFTDKFINIIEEHPDNIINYSISIFTPYVMLYYILDIGTIIPYGDFIEFFLDNSNSENQYIHDFIYTVADFCNNYTIEEILDEGLILLAARSTIYGTN